MSNVAEFILRISREGTGEAQAMAADLSNVDRAALALTQQLMQVNAAQVAAGGGAAGLTPNLVNATGGFRQMHMVAGTLSTLFATGLSPGTMLNVGRSLAYIGMQAQGTALALSGGTFLAVSAALALVGLAFQKNKDATDAAKKATEDYAKAMDEARVVYREFHQMVAEGTPPTEREQAIALEKERAGLVLAKEELDRRQRAYDEALARQKAFDQQEQLTGSKSVFGYEAPLISSPVFQGQSPDDAKAMLAVAQQRVAMLERQYANVQQTPTAEHAADISKDYDLRVEAKRRLIESDKQADAEYAADLDAQVKQRSITELDAFDQRQFQEKDLFEKTQANLQDIAAIYQKQADDLQADHDKKGSETALANKQKTLDAIAALESANAVKLTKAEGDRAALVLKNAEAAAKTESDVRLKLAEASGNTLLQKEMQIDRMIADMRKEVAAAHPGETGPTGADFQLQGAGDALKMQAQFDEKVKETNETLSEYRQKIADTNSALQAGTIDTSEARTNIKSYEQSIRDAVAGALPDLKRLLDALKELGKLHPELKIDTKALERAAAKVDEEAKRMATHVQGSTERLMTQWGDLGSQLDQFAASTLQNVANTSSQVLTDMVTGVKTGSAAWKELGRTAIQMIIEIALEYVIGKIVMMAIDKIFHQQSQGQAKETAVSSGVAGGAKAGEQGGWVGLLIYIVLFAAMIAAITAMAGGFAEGGFVERRRRFPTGGFVNGPGGPKDDAIPAMLSNGEFVLPADATAFYGAPLLEAMRTRAVAPQAVATMAAGGFAGAYRGGNVHISPRLNMPSVIVAIGDAELERIHASGQAKDAFVAHVVVHSGHIQKSLDKKRGYRL